MSKRGKWNTKELIQVQNEKNLSHAGHLRKHVVMLNTCLYINEASDVIITHSCHH